MGENITYKNIQSGQKKSLNKFMGQNFTNRNIQPGQKK